MDRKGAGSPAAELGPLAWLAAAVFVCYGGAGGLLRLGFYLDDWSLLADIVFESRAGAGSLLKLAASHASRPLSFLAWYLPYEAFGLRPPLWQLLAAALQWALSAAFYLVLRGFALDRAAALLGALVFLALPNKDATMFWPAVALLNTSALLAFLGAWLMHARYVAAGGERRLAASAALLLVSLGFYEQGFFLLPIWLLAPGADARRLRRSVAVCGAAVAAFAAFKFVLLPLLLPYAKAIRASPGHAAFVYYMAARATLDPRWWLYVVRCAWAGAQVLPLLAAAALALPWAAWKLTSGEPGGGGERRRLALWGAAVWALGYLPLCFSDYAPAAYDEMNRLNQLPMLGLSAGLAAWAAGGKTVSRGALAALASFGLAANLSFSEIWRESYRRQLAVRSRVLETLPAWPRGKGLIVRLPESHVAGKAPVFVTKYDVSGAVRLWTGDRWREAWSVTPATRFEAGSAVLYGERRGYSSLLLLEMPSGRLSSLEDPAARARLSYETR